MKNNHATCPDCKRKLHTITTDDIIEIDDYVLLIKDIPLIVCAYPECETEYHSGDVLHKRDLLISQFKRQISNTFTNREIVISFPISFLSLSKNM